MKNLKYVLLAVVAVFILSSCGYNTMVSKQEGVNSQWANVENAYQRRADLIPNLVNTVKGYAQHEQETFTQVTEARARATQMTIDPENLTEEAIQQYQQAQGQLSSAIGRLLYSGELPRTESQSELFSASGRIGRYGKPNSVERNKFNQIVQDFNSYIRQFRD